MHRGPDIRELLERHPRLELESLPPYAPELNPVEQMWSQLKWTELANFAPQNVDDLEKEVHRTMNQFRTDRGRLLTFFTGSELPWRKLSDGQ